MQVARGDFESDLEIEDRRCDASTMSRPQRMAFPAALSHGPSRGNACLAISHDDEDRHLFLKTLQDVVPRYHLSQERFWLQLYPYAHAIGVVHVEHIDGCP